MITAKMRDGRDMILVVAAAGCTAASGMRFGFHPARNASRLSPIEALRYE